MVDTQELTDPEESTEYSLNDQDTLAYEIDNVLGIFNTERNFNITKNFTKNGVAYESFKIGTTPSKYSVYIVHYFKTDDSIRIRLNKDNEDLIFKLGGTDPLVIKLKEYFREHRHHFELVEHSFDYQWDTSAKDAWLTTYQQSAQLDHLWDAHIKEDITHSKQQQPTTHEEAKTPMKEA